MKTEDRIRQSAVRTSARQNAGLHVPANPRKHGGTYWGWIATPAAAFAGIVAGLSLNTTALRQEMSVTQVCDTVFVHDVRYDTLWQTRVEEKERVVIKEPITAKTVQEDHEAVMAETRPKNEAEPSVTSHDANICTSVSCDGIDYAMLASN